MNAPLPKDAMPEPERHAAARDEAVQAGVALIQGGADPAKVLALMYQVGHTCGTLETVGRQVDAVSDAFRKML